MYAFGRSKKPLVAAALSQNADTVLRDVALRA